MFGNMGKLQEMKKKMEESKERLETIIVEGVALEGKIKVEMSASKTMQGVSIDNDFRMSASNEEFEEAMQLAITRAMEQADNVSQSEMQGVANELMPGMGGMM